jgi:CBS domain-containing protein
MSVGTICNREVVVTEKESSVSEAAKLMREYHVGNVIVIENRNGLNYPVGVVTDRDIVVKLIAKDIDIDAVDVGIIMAEDLVVARENDDLIDTVKKMCSKGIRRLPVVDAGGALIGILAMDDLIDLLAEQLRDLAGLIRKELLYEKDLRP